jgi:HemY protein
MSAAEFALDEQQPGKALAAIERFHGGGPRHIQSLRTALRAYEQSGDWVRVLPVLRLLEKRDALPEPAIRGMRARACRGLFAQPDLDAAGVRELLRSLKAAEREMPETVEAAAAAFARAGDETQARRLIESAMKKEYSPLLLRRYALLDAVPARERIEFAEQWLSSYGDDGALSLVLGRLCMAESLWGKAQEFLERSLARSESAAAHVALAELFEAIGKPDEAAGHFRAAALLPQGQDAG